MKKITFTGFVILYILFSYSSFAQKKDSLSNIRSQVEPAGKGTVDPVNSFWDELNSLRDKTPDQLSADDIRNIESTISYLETENKRLDIIMGSITELNPFFKEYLPQYIVEDEEMQIRLVNQLRMYFGLNESAMNKMKTDIKNGRIQIRVIQKPLTEDDLAEETPERALIGIYLDQFKIVGSQTLVNALGEDLYNKLLGDADRFKVKSGSGPLYKEPKFATTDVSISGGTLAMNLQSDTALIKIGANVAIGYDVLNLPFWYGSVWNVSAFYQPDPDQYYMVGALIPFRPGDSEVGLIGPIQLKSRKLNGTNGISAEFGKKLCTMLLKEDEWEENSLLSIYLGGSFSYSDLKTKGDNILVDQNGVKIDGTNNSFYFISTHAIGFLGLSAPSILSGLRLDVGYGTFAVNNVIIDKDGESIKKLRKTQISDLYSKLTYNHEGVTNYSLSAQYFNESIMLSGVLKIFSWLGLEVKYARIVGRDLDPWEYRDYVTVSPRFSFSF
jgi:hypothetical protein